MNAAAFRIILAVDMYLYPIVENRGFDFRKSASSRSVFAAFSISSKVLGFRITCIACSIAATTGKYMYWFRRPDTDRTISSKDASLSSFSITSCASFTFTLLPPSHCAPTTESLYTASFPDHPQCPRPSLNLLVSSPERQPPSLSSSQESGWR